MEYFKDSGATVLMVSHSINQIKEICQRALWLDNGKINEIGDVEEVCNVYQKALMG
jgi:ABC-type polysaccharide/polyol phosphate transport system ATPase subunit